MIQSITVANLDAASDLGAGTISETSCERDNKDDGWEV